VLSEQVQSISYLKSHTAEIVDRLGKGGEALVITQNGQAKAVLQDIAAYEDTQETLALLKLLALGKRQVEEGKVETAEEVFKRLRQRIKAKHAA